jgi:hypothetical protein
VGGPASFSRDGDLLLRRLSADPAEKKVATFVRFGSYHFMDLATRSLGPISGAFPAKLRGPRRRCATVSLACPVSRSLCFVWGASALPGASCACVWALFGTRAVAYCARMEAVAAYISCREKCGPCVDSCRWEWATVSELIWRGQFCLHSHAWKLITYIYLCLTG